MIPNDVIRSPLLTSGDKEIYAILLSFCDASKPVLRTNTNKRALATISRMSMSGVRNCLSNLKRVGLIKTHLKPNSDYVIYTVVTKPSSGLCPEPLKGRQWSAVIAYGNELGGLRKNQRRKSSTFGKNRRPITPNTSQPQFGEDQVGGYHSSVRGADTPVSGVGHSSVRGVTLESHQENITSKEQEKNTPYGVNQVADAPLDSTSGDILGRPFLAPAALGNGTGKNDGRSCVPLDTTIPTNPHPEMAGVEQPQEKTMARPTPEQEKAERERQAKLRGGTPPVSFESNRERGDDLKRHPSAMSAAEPVAKGKKGPKKPVDGLGPEAEALIPDPATVKDVPTVPWGLYTHFCKAVRNRWPEAVLAQRDMAALKWGKELLAKFQPKDLYEMIQVLVLDYEHIDGARVFFKFKGGPTPTFKQLYTNADLIASYVGKGIISTGAYAEDYRRRHGPSAPSDKPMTNADYIAIELEKERKKQAP